MRKILSLILLLFLILSCESVGIDKGGEGAKEDVNNVGYKIPDLAGYKKNIIIEIPWGPKKGELGYDEYKSPDGRIYHNNYLSMAANSDNVYIADDVNKTISKYTVNGALEWSINYPKTLRLPRILYGADDNLYIHLITRTELIEEKWTQFYVIYKINKLGNIEKIFENEYMKNIVRFAVDNKSNLYAIIESNDRYYIILFNSQGSLLWKKESWGANSVIFGSDNMLRVLTWSAGRCTLEILNAEGEVLSQYRLQDLDSDSYLKLIAVDEKGNSHLHGGKVYAVVDSKGNILETINYFDHWNHLRFPTVDPAGNLYYAFTDFNNIPKVPFVIVKYEKKQE